MAFWMPSRLPIDEADRGDRDADAEDDVGERPGEEVEDRLAEADEGSTATGPPP